MKLHAYIVYCGDPLEESALVFAPNARVARDIGWEQCSINPVFIYTKVDFRPDLDFMLRNGVTEPYVETDPAILRRAGWMCEGDSLCAHCELAELDRAFPLCPDCDYCAECGHHEECPRKEQPNGKN